jgi:hypothetical protein
VEASAALKMEIVEQIDDDVSRRRYEVHIPRGAVAVHRHGTAALGQEGRGKLMPFIGTVMFQSANKTASTVNLVRLACPSQQNLRAR